MSIQGKPTIHKIEDGTNRRDMYFILKEINAAMNSKFYEYTDMLEIISDSLRANEKFVAAGAVLKMQVEMLNLRHYVLENTQILTEYHANSGTRIIGEDATIMIIYENIPLNIVHFDCTRSSIFTCPFCTKSEYDMPQAQIGDDYTWVCDHCMITYYVRVRERTDEQIEFEKGWVGSIYQQRLDDLIKKSEKYNREMKKLKGETDESN